MSMSLMTEVWKSAPYKQSTLLILLALADAANDDGVCWPSVTTLAHKARVEPRQVRKAFIELETDGWLKREERVGRSTIYTITPGSHRTTSEPEVVPQDLSDATSGPPGQAVPQDRGVPQDSGPRSPRTGGAVPQDIQNHKEPQEEPSSSSSSEPEEDRTTIPDAMAMLRWAPHHVAFWQARDTYPEADLFAVTAAYLDSCAAGGYTASSSRWLSWVAEGERRRKEREDRENQAVDPTYLAEIRQQYNERRGITE